MSESDIVALCEEYVNRKFDEEDLESLRAFLRSLQKQKVPRAEKEAPKKHFSVKTAGLARPNTSGAASTELPSYVKEKREIDTNALREERLAEANTAQGVKARLGAWQEKVQKAEDGDLPDNSKLAEERVSEAKAGAGVKDRLGAWNQKIDKEDQQVTTDEKAKAERLAELQGVGSVKNRYQVKEDDDVKTSPQERVAEVKTGSLKERLGAYQQVAEKSEVAKTGDAKEELKGVSGLKERLGAYTNAAETSDAPRNASDSPQLDAIRKTSSVQKGKENWNKVAGSSNDAPVDKKAEILAEAKAGSSLKDRLNVWNEKGAEPENAGPRKEPIKIDYGF